MLKKKGDNVSYFSIDDQRDATNANVLVKKAHGKHERITVKARAYPHWALDCAGDPLI